MYGTHLLISFSRARKHYPPIACPGLSGGRCYTLDDRAGEVCALRLLIEDDLLQGQLGEGGEGRARSDLGIRGDEACRDGRPTDDTAEGAEDGYLAEGGGLRIVIDINRVAREVAGDVILQGAHRRALVVQAQLDVLGAIEVEGKDARGVAPLGALEVVLILSCGGLLGLTA